MEKLKFLTITAEDTSGRRAAKSLTRAEIEGNPDVVWWTVSKIMRELSGGNVFTMPRSARADPVKEAVIKNRNAIQKAYERHYVSRQHEKPPCGACHFYQGGYAALSEILGESGLLPKRPESAEKPLRPKPIFPNSVVPAVGNTGLLPANVAEECQCGTTPDHDMYSQGTDYYVFCPNEECDAQTPNQKTLEIAVRVWNAMQEAARRER